MDSSNKASNKNYVQGAQQSLNSMQSQGSNSSSNQLLVPQAKQGLNNLKTEVATEIGLQNYENIDKGSLSSRQNGSVGGEMVKRMVESYEKGI